MNRDKRKYLLKLLRSQLNPFADMIDPLARILTIRNPEQRAIAFDNFVGEELRVQVDAMLLESTPRTFSIRYPAQAIGQHVLKPILKDLEVAFAPTEPPSEHVRKMAAATLKEMFGEPGGNIETFGRAMRSTLEQRRDVIYTPAPAIDVCGLHLVITKERLAQINDIVRKDGLVKAFEYRPMPAKPADYTEYCARSALNELKDDKDE